MSPKTGNQKSYIDAFRTHDIVFGIGRPVLARPIWRWPWPLPVPKQSGLLEARQLIHSLEGIAFRPFTQADVLHPLVWKIITAYKKKQDSGAIASEPHATISKIIKKSA